MDSLIIFFVLLLSHFQLKSLESQGFCTWKVTDFPLPVESPSAKIAVCLISLGLFIIAAAEFSVAILAKLYGLAPLFEL